MSTPASGEFRRSSRLFRERRRECGKQLVAGAIEQPFPFIGLPKRRPATRDPHALEILDPSRTHAGRINDGPAVDGIESHMPAAGPDALSTKSG